MKIAIFSTKGGVGKTSISASLAIDLNYHLITNDLSNIINMYSKAKYRTGQLPLFTDEVIYDLGGFKDPAANAAIEDCDCLVIPITPDSNALLKGLETIRNFKHKKIIVVGNNIETEKDKKDIELVINQYFSSLNIEFFYIRKTKMFKNAMEAGLSALKLFEKDNLSRHTYKNGIHDYLLLLKRFSKKGEKI